MGGASCNLVVRARNVDFLPKWPSWKKAIESEFHPGGSFVEIVLVDVSSGGASAVEHCCACSATNTDIWIDDEIVLVGECEDKTLSRGQRLEAEWNNPRYREEAVNSRSRWRTHTKKHSFQNSNVALVVSTAFLTGAPSTLFRGLPAASMSAIRSAMMLDARSLAFARPICVSLRGTIHICVFLSTIILRLY